MNLSARYRLTFFFTALFSFLIIATLGLLYARISTIFHRDFQREMVHDGRVIAELFKEEVKLDALTEFQHEIQEFEIEVQVLDGDQRAIVESKGWIESGVNINQSELNQIKQEPLYRVINIGKRPFGLFSRPVHIPDVGQFSLHILRTQEGFHKILNTLMQWMLIITPFMILLSAVAGYYFSKKTLEAEERVVDRLKKFTADASHELKIPLTSMRVGLEIALRKDRSAEEYKDVVRSALGEAEHLSRLTQDLLLLSHSDSKELTLQKQPVFLPEYLKEILAQAQGLIDDDKNIAVMDSVPPATVQLDPERIRQLLFNLLDNAVKYNRPGGKIFLSAEDLSEEFKLIVRDEGIGIPESDLKKIFERFYRVDKARSRDQGGAGLGLSIVQKIVAAHGGRIHVASRLGEGSTFTVYLPK